MQVLLKSKELAGLRLAMRKRLIREGSEKTLLATSCRKLREHNYVKPPADLRKEEPRRERRHTTARTFAAGQSIVDDGMNESSRFESAQVKLDAWLTT